MTVQEVKREVIRVIKDSTETELEISESTQLFDEMGMSSMEAFVMLSDLEEEFNINIPAVSLRKVKIVGEICELIISILSK
ncbi:MAG: acyl carrier protein [Lachnospiraceae bacterium]|nr:acyl carrier protein [Lachnospiraceae bacterium]